MHPALARRTRGASRRLAAAAVGVALASIAAVALWRCTHPAMSTCEREAQQGDQEHAVRACLASYEQTRDDRDRVRAARAYLKLGRLDDARNLAEQLLHGPCLGDGHQILSYIALRRAHLDEARMHAVLAQAVHSNLGDRGGLARDAVSLSQIAWRAGEFTTALRRADEALTWLAALQDSRTEMVALLARADALRRMGDTRSAATALTAAAKRATAPCDKAWTRVKNAMCLWESGEDSLAMLEFTGAEKDNQQCGSEDIWSQIAFNEAWLLRRKDPAAALAKLDALTRAEEDPVANLVLRGDIAADRGALSEAERDFTQAAALEPPDADWPWEIARALAEVATLRGDVLDDMLAEHHYRRATAMVTALRATARSRSAYFVSSHRGPFDGLIALLARQGRWRDVLAVILDLDASDMLRATADEAVARRRGGSDVDPLAPGSVATPSPTVDDLLVAWRSRDLVIVIAPSAPPFGPDHEQAYRLYLHDGEVIGEAVADASVARASAAELFAHPSDAAAAKTLGRMFIPPESSSRTLHVLAIGSLGKVPLAALRADDGSLILQRRPLVRVLALRASHPAAVGDGPPAVIADSRGDLLGAAIEGVIVAQTLGPETQLSGARTAVPATRSRLWAARDAALLHIAGHVGVLGQWRALRLADGDVEPAEIVQNRLAPRIAVLASCGSAAARDEEGWGSIAAALLEAGTSVVIATDRSLDDEIALALISQFYAQPDWRSDPPRALARVQSAAAARAATSDSATAAQAWAAFSVLGRAPEIRLRSAAR